MVAKRVVTMAAEMDVTAVGGATTEAMVAQIRMLTADVQTIKGDLQKAEVLLATFEKALEMDILRLNAESITNQGGIGTLNEQTGSMIMRMNGIEADATAQIGKVTTDTKEEFKKVMEGMNKLDARMNHQESLMGTRVSNLEVALTTEIERMSQVGKKLQEHEDKITIDMSALKEKITATKDQTGDKSQGSHSRSILESKTVANLKVLGDNKGSFREWNDKFKNAVGEAKPGSRKILEWWKNWERTRT